jgi:hypothetical protein
VSRRCSGGGLVVCGGWGLCAARVVAVAGVKAGRRPPRRGLALTPARGGAVSSSGSDRQRGASVGLGLVCGTVVLANWGGWQRLGCRGIPSPTVLASMVRSGHDQTGSSNRPLSAAAGGCGSQARAGLVAAADRELAGLGVPRRRGDAGRTRRSTCRCSCSPGVGCARS